MDTMQVTAEEREQVMTIIRQVVRSTFAGIDYASVEDLAAYAEYQWRKANSNKEDYLKPKRVQKKVTRFIMSQASRVPTAQAQYAPGPQPAPGPAPRPLTMSASDPVSAPPTSARRPQSSSSSSGAASTSMHAMQMDRQRSTASEIATAVASTGQAGTAPGAAFASAARPQSSASPRSQQVFPAIASIPQVPPLPKLPPMTQEESQDAIARMDVYNKTKSEQLYGGELREQESRVMKGSEVMRLQAYVVHVDNASRKAGTLLHQSSAGSNGASSAAASGAGAAAASKKIPGSTLEPLPRDPSKLASWRDLVTSIQTFASNPCMGDQCSKHGSHSCKDVRNVITLLKDRCLKPATTRFKAAFGLPDNEELAPPIEDPATRGHYAIVDAEVGTAMAPPPAPAASSSSSAASTETNRQRRLRYIREAGEYLTTGGVGRQPSATSYTQKWSRVVRHYFLCQDKDCPLACRVSLAAITREHISRQLRFDQCQVNLFATMKNDMQRHVHELQRQCQQQHFELHQGAMPKEKRAEAERKLMELLKRVQRYYLRANYYEQGLERCRKQQDRSLYRHKEVMNRDKAFSASEKRAVTFQSLDPQISLLHTASYEELSQHLYSLRFDFNAIYTPKDIHDRCAPVLSRLLAKDSRHNFFSSRVNAKELGLPDYHDIVKRPMDLGTIKRRLEQKRYRSLKGFSDDVRQVWYNAILYNPPGSEVALIAEEFALYFDEMMNQVFAEAEREQSEILLRDMHDSKQGLEQERLQDRRQQMLLREKGQVVAVDAQAQFTNNVCFLCAGYKFVFEPSMLYCTLCRKRIQSGQSFYRNKDNNVHYCTTCHGSKVPADSSSDSTIIPKKLLIKAKHEYIDEEEWVQCSVCDKWMHNICGMFNRYHDQVQSQTLVCPHCLLQEMKIRKSPKPIRSSQGLRARDLPQYRLGKRIEKAVHKLILQRQIDSLIGASPDSAAGSSLEQVLKNPSARVREEASKSYPIPTVRVRVVSDSWYTTPVPVALRNRYPQQIPQKEYRHRSRALALFQELDGADVLVFTMYVQEYWDDCPGPNRRSAYLSYLDSVRYFDPPELRTLVFHEIILEYMRDLKSRGFLQLVLWACPPLKGDDYIFFCHPPDYQNPKSERLRKWYQDMFDTAHETGIIDKVVYLADDFFPTKSGEEGGRQRSMLDLPLFKGDYWPGEADTYAQELASSEADVVQSSVFKGRKWLWHYHLYTDPNAKPLDMEPLVPQASAAMVSDAQRPSSRAGSTPTARTASGSLHAPVPFRRYSRAQHASLWWLACRRRRGEASGPQQPMLSDDMARDGARSPAAFGLDLSAGMSRSQYMIDDGDDDDDDGLGDGSGPASKKSSKASSKKGKVKGKKARSKRKGRAGGRARRSSTGRDRGSMAGTDGDASTGNAKSHTTKGRMVNATSAHLVADALANKVADYVVNLRYDFFVAKLWPSCQVCKSFIVSGNQWYSPVHLEDGESVNLCDGCYALERSKREGTGGRLCSDAFVRQLQKRPALSGESELEVLKELKEDGDKQPSAVASSGSASSSSSAASSSSSASSAQVAMHDDSSSSDPGTQASARSLRQGGLMSPEVLASSGAGGASPPKQFSYLVDLFRNGLRHDVDPLVSCEFWETREYFLELCQGNHYQFDYLRRAKHSTAMVLYHMRNPKMPSFVHVCNNCSQKILKGNRWACQECPEFDLCDACYDYTQRGRLPKHKHRLKAIPVSFTKRDREAREMEEMKPYVAALEQACNVQVAPADLALVTPHALETARRLLQGGAPPPASGPGAAAPRLQRLVELHAKSCGQMPGRCPIPMCNAIRARAARPRLDARAAAAAERSREAAYARLQMQQQQQMQQHAAAASGAMVHHRPQVPAVAYSGHGPNHRGQVGTGRRSRQWERFQDSAVLEREIIRTEGRPDDNVRALLSDTYHTLKVSDQAKAKFRSNLATLAVRRWARTDKGDRATKDDTKPVQEQKNAIRFDYYCTTYEHGAALVFLLMSKLLPEYAASCHRMNQTPPVNLNEQMVQRCKADVYVSYQRQVYSQNRHATSAGRTAPAAAHPPRTRAVGSSGAAAPQAAVALDPALSLAMSLVSQATRPSGETAQAGQKRPRPADSPAGAAANSGSSAAENTDEAAGGSSTEGTGEAAKRARHK